MKNIRHLELFAGIGGFRKAIDLFAKDNSYASTCVGYSEFDKYANLTYQSNFENDKVTDMGDIIDFNDDQSNIRKLKDFNILTGGFPCQPFSSMGNKKGLHDSRGNLFYEIVKILKVKNPQIVILENVRNFKNHDEGRTFSTVKRILKEECGYNVYWDVFNTANFGLPQNRRRVYILCVKTKPSESFVFEESTIAKNLHEDIKNTSLNTYKDTRAILSKNVNEKYYLSNKIKKTILSSGTGGFKAKPEINKLTARTLTATMLKMHRAGQDNYYSDEFTKTTRSESKAHADFIVPKTKYNSYNIRKLTPKEGLKLQGFDTEFYVKANKAGVSDTQLYKQIGNAISVNVAYGIIHYLKTKKVGIFR